MTTRCSFIAIASPIFLVVAMLLLPCTTASAQLREVVKACVSDVKAQCPGVEPGEGRIRACVKTHLKDLSEPCRNVVLKAVTVKACAADVIKVCADSKPRLGRIKACMKDHLADLSAPCQEALANAAAGKE